MTATLIQTLILGYVLISTVVALADGFTLQYLIEKVVLRHDGTKAEVELLAHFPMVGVAAPLCFLLFGVRACRACHLPNPILMGRSLSE